jgi:hypothetical protein
LPTLSPFTFEQFKIVLSSSSLTDEDLVKLKEQVATILGITPRTLEYRRLQLVLQHDEGGRRGHGQIVVLTIPTGPLSDKQEADLLAIFGASLSMPTAAPVTLPSLPSPTPIGSPTLSLVPRPTSTHSLPPTPAALL